MDSIRFRLRSFLVASLVVLGVGTGGFMMVEGLSFFDAFYFSIVTIATVGYGDFHPATPVGKALSIVIIVLGVGTFLGVVANASEMMLNRREKEARLEKIHLLIGVFFSEVGNQLIKTLRAYDSGLLRLREDLSVDYDWTDRDFSRIDTYLKAFRYKVDAAKIDLDDLYRLLSGKRSLLVRLMENPNLIEHESFTDLLRAVFHLTEELAQRQGIPRPLPDSDMRHLGGDTERVFGLISHQWLDYMLFLKKNYPYLFSLAVRMNPFDPQASRVVK